MGPVRMLAPPAAKSKAAELQRSKVAAQRPRRSAVEQAHMLHRSVGNHAILPALAQRATVARTEPDMREQKDDIARIASHEVAPSWDFSKIPLFSPGRAEPPKTPPLSPAPCVPAGHIQAKLRAGAIDDSFEREADRVADRMMRMPAPEVSVVAGSPQISRKSAACGEEVELQTKPAEPRAAGGEAPGILHEVLRSPGQPLDPASRAYFEPRFGHDFGHVRVHTDPTAAVAARTVAAHAFTVGRHIVFGESQYAPYGATGRHLLAHELTHIVQQRAAGPVLQRRAANCPAAPPSPSTIKTMDDFIALVQRVEADAATKNEPIATARLIARTKYDTTAWDWLLPSTKGQAGVERQTSYWDQFSGTKDKPGLTHGASNVTADDIGSLCFKLIVATPDGPMDPMHIIAGIVAGAETLPAGTGATGLATLVAPLPASVSQRAASTWVGDIGKAAAEWATEYPLQKEDRAQGTKASHDPKDYYFGEKADYMHANASPQDLLADIDGVAMTSKSPASGFALDKAKPLSDNLRLFARSGRKSRFHVFCSVEGLAVKADGVTLTSQAQATIRQRITDFALWYMGNDPDVIKHVLAQEVFEKMSGPSWIDKALGGGEGYMSYDEQVMKRWGEWVWFADQFITFVQDGLAAERAD
jgi:uncharacterized protein DUF4157